jgi:hypothetical protein
MDIDTVLGGLIIVGFASAVIAIEAYVYSIQNDSSLFSDLRKEAGALWPWLPYAAPPALLACTTYGLLRGAKIWAIGSGIAFVFALCVLVFLTVRSGSSRK